MRGSGTVLVTACPFAHVPERMDDLLRVHIWPRADCRTRCAGAEALNWSGRTTYCLHCSRAMEDDMQAVEIQAHAAKLFAAKGMKAIAEAAHKAEACERGGDAEQAKDWRRIEAALRQMSGPRAK